MIGGKSGLGSGIMHNDPSPPDSRWIVLDPDELEAMMKGLTGDISVKLVRKRSFLFCRCANVLEDASVELDEAVGWNP
jgi:hypothetical protein